MDLPLTMARPEKNHHSTYVHLDQPGPVVSLFLSRGGQVTIHYTSVPRPLLRPCTTTSRLVRLSRNCFIHHRACVLFPLYIFTAYWNYFL